MELGLYTFADVSPEPGPDAIGPHERLRNLIEEITLADQVGLDVFGLGEHHRPDYAASAPVVALAAAAEHTKRIKLTSAVTVLSSDDPVRVFQQFATLDQLSAGRAEIMAGRGSFIESFPLFGYNLEDYDELFSEKLDLLLKLRDSVKVTWSGRLRAPINDRGVYPRPYQDKLPIWIAVGGTPQSVARAATLGLPLALAIIGGEPHRFAPLFELYRETARRAGHDPAEPGHQPQRAWLRRRDDGAGRRRFLRPAGGSDEPHRPRARLGSDQPRAFRPVAVADRRTVRRQSRNRSPRRSSPSTGSSATTASCCRWRSASCRTPRS